MLTDQDKFIYNSFLIANKTNQNKPFKVRKNFDKIDDSVYIQIKKLACFFERNKNINQSDFFNAPYSVYGKDNYFGIEFYNTRKAVKCYSIYIKQKQRNDPDSDEVITECKECCKFIYDFCVTNNITLFEYNNLYTESTPKVVQHLKEHKINFYMIHALKADRIISRVESNLLDFLIPDFNLLLRDTRVNYLRSKKLKTMLEKALISIEKQLTKYKTITNNK